jgi:hypothetical protein
LNSPGAANSARGAQRLVGDAVKQARRLLSPDRRVLVRMDAAYYGRGAVHAALAGGASVSVTVRMNAQIKAAIAAIDPAAWTTIDYTDAVLDEASGRWTSRAEVAETQFVAFNNGKKSERVPGRLVVRASRTSTPRPRPPPVKARCSTSGASTPSSPPPTRDLGHRGHRQDPPRARDHRAGPRRPQGLSARAPTLVLLCGQRCLVGAGGDGVQPHPRRGQPDPAAAGEGDHRDHPPQAHQRAVQSRHLGPPDHPASATGLAWQTAWTRLFDTVSDPPPTLAA